MFENIEKLIEQAEQKALEPDYGFYYPITEAAEQLNKILPPGLNKYQNPEELIDKFVKRYFEKCENDGVTIEQFGHMAYGEADDFQSTHETLVNAGYTHVTEDILKTQPTRGLKERLRRIMGEEYYQDCCNLGSHWIH